MSGHVLFQGCAAPRAEALAASSGGELAALTSGRPARMEFRMKTTLVIDDGVMRSLKRRAVEERRTMSELVEAALRAFLRERRAPPELPPLPTWHGGAERVDISDRDALYDFMERAP